MFRIKKEQMEFFAERTKAKFCAKMVGYLLGQHAARAEARARQDGLTLEAWVSAAVDKASRWKIVTEPETAQLMLLLMLLGLRADEALPWVRDVLANKELYAVGKVRRLLRRAREHDVPHLSEILVFPEFLDASLEAELELADGDVEEPQGGADGVLTDPAVSVEGP